MGFFAKLLFKNRISLFFLPMSLSVKILRDSLFYFFNNLSFKDKEDLYYHATKSFLKKDLEIKGGVIKLKFNNKPLLVSFKKGTIFNLSTAFSLLGHDFDVKSCYADLINNFEINTFYDVGSNYGQHSALILTHGITCFSFEPNKTCHKQIMKYDKINEFKNHFLVKNAVGNSNGFVYLNYNEDETWNGKIILNKKNKIDEIIEKTEIIKLDDFVKSNPTPNLIKIDTEGFEIEVLKGSVNLIQNSKPFIVFESLNYELMSFFKKMGYSVFDIKNSYNEVINFNNKISSVNFLACHKNINLPFKTGNN